MDNDIEMINYRDGGRGEFAKKAGKNHGSWRVFFPNGRLKIERTFENGRENGISRTWNASGQLIDEKVYQDDALHGHWRIWDDFGVLTQDSEFRFGQHLSFAQINHEPTGDLNRLLQPYLELTAKTAASAYTRALASLSQSCFEAVPTASMDSVKSLTSQLGIVTHLPAQKSWPTCSGVPMVPLLQVCASELPTDLKVLQGIAFLAVFGPAHHPNTDESDLIFVATKSLDELVPILPPEGCLRRNPKSISWELNEKEYPHRNDLSPGLRAYAEDHEPDSELFSKGAKLTTKVGGWPGWIQSSSIAGHGDLILQIDSCDFDDWDAGDSTIFYCFRRHGSNEIYCLADMF
jgi:MORN repeat variant